VVRQPQLQGKLDHIPYTLEEWLEVHGCHTTREQAELIQAIVDEAKGEIMPSEHELAERRRYDSQPKGCLSSTFSRLVSLFEPKSTPPPDPPKPSPVKLTYIAPEEWERERRRFRNR